MYTVQRVMWMFSLVLSIMLLAYIIYLPHVKLGGIVGEEVVVEDNEYYLPLPGKATNMSVEEVILLRRSIRDYSGEPIGIRELSMILWAAQGITDTVNKFRSAPSAGATYPLEIYLVVGENTVAINGTSFLPSGIYRYIVERHSIILVKEGDYMDELAEAALNQQWVRDAAVDIVICAVYERTTSVYGERGYRYVYMEVGHVGENIYLMATALGLGTVAVGAFDDNDVAEIIGVNEDIHPLYIMPIGKPSVPPVNSFDNIDKYYVERREEG